MVRPRRARLFGSMFVTGFVAVYDLVMALLVEGDLIRSLYAVVALGSGWVSGIFLGQYLTLTRFTVLMRGAVEAPDREAVLARVDRGLAAYPNLWPSAVPIIAVTLTLVGGALVTVLRFVLAGEP